MSGTKYPRRSLYTFCIRTIAREIYFGLHKHNIDALPELFRIDVHRELELIHHLNKL